MRLKICGITELAQAIAIAELGVDTLGFICVADSPRYLEATRIQQITSKLPKQVSKIGVFVNQTVETIVTVLETAGLTGIQLHGDETPSQCAQLREILPRVEIIKAFRYRDKKSLATLEEYLPYIDTILVDTYQKNVYGGTGKTLDWQQLRDFRPKRPWLLAGGLNADNILLALQTVHCDGFDVSSGVEISPGKKDLAKVRHLVSILNSYKSSLPSSN
ncbi:MAG: phosphoribosylanthranilate isomerase [Geminocystis sp.]|nr:phosphoribosylanthranilate isomerase [Geminocystis sp.]HIK36922.1 phosphoribosylanthranilate isomerase [Geminocystis sp. M7585_C2015_104]MCS7147827.1 phosphoribosylanthranilate isomerase [Geminocystis sp.]MCX8079530.1 phosphoribosylanthranilate isomerase [Geminocystis sp.]MDW8116806.1 phosphoribosylanthranilate isomerase [Geminocystis sp.]